MPAEQLALAVPCPPPVAAEPRRYFECRGPRDWQPVVCAIYFGDSSGLPSPPFPEVRTRPLAPRNVLIRRADGSAAVRPVRALRRRHPQEPR